MTGWATAYAGCDDAAIVEMANAGLLRRGRKDAAAGLVAVVEETGDGVVVSVGTGGAQVRLGAKGPAAAVCSCPTAGICQHIVSALLWAGDQAGDAPAPTAEPQAQPAVEAPKARTSSATSRKLSAEARRRSEAIAETRASIEPLVATGLAHLGADDAAQLLAVAGRARAAGIEAVNGVQLSAAVRAAAGLVGDLADRDDTVDEAQVLEALAEIWALTEALPSRRPEGAAKPATEELDLPRLVPLGARWWTSPGGGRGVTFMGWDAAAARVRTVTTGRSAGADPAFQRSWDTPVLWGCSFSRLCGGEVALGNVRLNPDGTLAASGRPRVSTGAALSTDALLPIAAATEADPAPADVVGFGRRATQVRLVMVRDSGDVGVDEVRQEMTWTVATADGHRLQLRLPVADAHGTSTLLSAVAVSKRVVAVAVDRHQDRDEPVGLFVEREGGSLHLVCPTITPHWELGSGSRWTAWRQLTRRIETLRRRADRVAPVRTSLPPAERACTIVSDVLVSVATTGRLRLTPSQRTDLIAASALARDLGMRTLEHVLAGLTEPEGERISPEAVLRSAFLVARARAVLSA
ncbi:hypothetical protein [Nocardioides albus]|uniref:SWIM-type domain-containing protein n=1 Tax=Nocardioides albus TaxID=1841 RepID=A0A7W5A464_9ACTN|nr:hypothetical protein [Nocardioides albus]MBB3089211.1 hypothetical protein [Nocardioides albus]GGU13511.1 hypothetical protein GCM10007979_09750 [Nocardioides albus]